MKGIGSLDHLPNALKLWVRSPLWIWQSFVLGECIQLRALACGRFLAHIIVNLPSEEAKMSTVMAALSSAST